MPCIVKVFASERVLSKAFFGEISPYFLLGNYLGQLLCILPGNPRFIMGKVVICQFPVLFWVGKANHQVLPLGSGNWMDLVVFFQHLAGKDHIPTVNSYGKTLKNPVTFAQLLEKVEAIEGLKRIRFMTSHPKDLSDELIQYMGKSRKVCHHLHLPMQSGSSRILKVMNRHYDKEKYLGLVEKIRKAVPDISLTTDIIVGFPGETEEDFQETLDVVEKSCFDTAFTFIYSKRSGTPAAKMEDQVPEDVVKDRFDRLLKLVQEKGREASSRFEGEVQEVLVETESKEKGIFTGRTQYNLLVHFPGTPDLLGKYINVRLDTCKGFYYMGTQV